MLRPQLCACWSCASSPMGGCPPNLREKEKRLRRMLGGRGSVVSFYIGYFLQFWAYDCVFGER
eukprot:182892-Alexandrium_andersonii.AAC.1